MRLLPALLAALSTETLAAGDFPQFPAPAATPGATHIEIAEHCAVIEGAMARAFEYGRDLANAQLVKTPPYQTLGAAQHSPPAWIIETIGTHRFHALSETARDLKPYWQSYGSTFVAAMMMDETPYTVAEGAKLISAYIECKTYGAQTAGT